MKSKKEEKHILVFGKVQGVWFRVFTSERAKELELSGWVRNLTNGSVEILVKGHDLKIKEFISKIKKGPEAAHVKSLTIKDAKNIQNPNTKAFEFNQDEKQDEKTTERFLILQDSSKALME